MAGESVVEQGRRLLREPSQPQVDQHVLDLLGALADRVAVLDTVASLLGRLDVLERQVAALQEKLCDGLDRVQATVEATRVRRPVRDDLGTILYVIDELQPPIYAMPVSAGVEPLGDDD